MQKDPFSNSCFLLTNRRRKRVSPHCSLFDLTALTLDGLPSHRQEHILARSGIELPRRALRHARSCCLITTRAVQGRSQNDCWRVSAGT